MKETVLEHFIDGNCYFVKKEIDTGFQSAIVSSSLGLAYKTVLIYDEVGQVVRAHYLDYEGNIVAYNGEIVFEFEGKQQTVQAVNGVADIPFVVVDAGTYVVRTANPDIENGEVTINA